MTISEVVARLDGFSDEETIYAVRAEGRWQPDSLAFVTEEPDDGKLTQTFDGVQMQYLLEVALAREAVEAYQELHYVLEPTDEEKMKAILYYAEHDAYLPPNEGRTYEVRNTPVV